MHQQLILECHQTLHVLLGGLFVKTHMLCNLRKCQIWVVVEQEQNAHLVGTYHKIVQFGCSWQFKLDNSSTHGEVPFNFSMVVLLLSFVKGGEAFNAAVDLLGD